MKKSLIALSIATIAACGGGGGGASDTDGNPTSPTPTSSTTLVAESNFKRGESIELALLSSNTLTNIQWQQTAGETITVYAKNSKVIGFEAPAVGDYAFEVSYTDKNGDNANLMHEFTVGSNNSLISAWLSHSVVEGNGVSARVYFDESLAVEDNFADDAVIETIRWTQTSGPTINFSESNNGKSAIFFDAPSVNQDTIIKFDVTAEVAGTTHSDTVVVVVENSNVNVATSQTSPFDNRLANVYAYKANSPYANDIVDCVYANSLTYENSCTFSTLPLIAHDTESPEVDDIMNRVVVSHDWMGERFQQWLEAFDDHGDFKNLLRATTAVVISYDIRPSFYHPYTGAIYLDPDDLWLTPAERDTINQAPDYRGAFGSELQFEMPWRYTLDNESVYYFPHIWQRASRELIDTKYAFASLLYHELAHSNDYFPKTIWNNIDPNERIVDFVFYQRIQPNEIMSTKLNALYELQGDEMHALGEVRFHGSSATESQQAYTTNDIANFFKTEGAPQFYSYSSTREDYAILFDGLMMKARYNVLRDVGVSDQAYDNVVWGQRGREGEVQIKPRLKFAVNAILPEYAQANDFIDALPAPTPLPTGVHWAETRALSTPSGQLENEKSLAEQLLRTSNESAIRLMPVENRRFKEVNLGKIH